MISNVGNVTSGSTSGGIHIENRLSKNWLQNWIIAILSVLFVLYCFIWTTRRGKSSINIFISLIFHGSQNYFFRWIKQNFFTFCTQKWCWILKSFFLVRCEDSIPGESSKGSNFNYIKNVRNQVGSYQDDKDILTTGLVFDQKMLESYKKAGYFVIDTLPVFLFEPSSCWVQQIG